MKNVETMNSVVYKWSIQSIKMTKTDIKLNWSNVQAVTCKITNK